MLLVDDELDETGHRWDCPKANEDLTIMSLIICRNHVPHQRKNNHRCIDASRMEARCCYCSGVMAWVSMTVIQKRKTGHSALVAWCEKLRLSVVTAKEVIAADEQVTNNITK